MENYFKIRYEFDYNEIHSRIDMCIKEHRSDYICVADGVILNIANRESKYLKVINGGMFSICDSSYVPLYLKWIYGIKRNQYSGSDIFKDVISQRKYRMIFLGTSEPILNALRVNLEKMNPDIASMKFLELPFCAVEEFNYEEIANIIHNDGADIIWIALGAPKQEYFMANLKNHLQGGVMIAVGAAFKFYSGIDANRAPKWMITYHLEFVYRIFSEPKKQVRRCLSIITSLPLLLYAEWKRKNRTYNIN